MDDDKFDVIIIGAGLAGSAAAYKLAQAGLQVVLVERGPYPGAKNLSGGILYGRVLHELIPNFWEEAPVERHITNNIVTFMTEDASFNVDYKSKALGDLPYNSFSVLRGKFDRWLGEKAEEAGAMLVPGIKVDRLLKENGRVVGIVAGDEEMRADVVIAADGANSFIAQEAGLRGRIPTGEIAVGVKELISLPREVIEERFNLTGDEGAAYGIVGFATRGVAGGGFFYTNTDSLSIGLVMHLDELMKAGLKPYDVMEDYLAHPLIAPLIKDGKLIEYGAHLVPEGGVEMMPQLFTDGLLVVGDAAGLSVNNGFVVRGMDLAIGSGVAAADTILEIKEKGDFSAQALSLYKTKLDASFVMADMRTYAKAPHFMKNPHLYEAFPAMLTGLMHEIYYQDMTPKKHMVPTLLDSVKKADLSLFDLMKDGLGGAKAL
jgi:electron transfer flavoprotein-quinone oxidoreductase